MDISKKGEKAGRELLDALVSHTKLPAELVEKEIETILESAGHSAGELTLDQLRAAMVAYLETFQADLIEGEQDPEGSVH